MIMQSFRLFGLNSTREYAQRISEAIEVPLSKHVEHYFEDHEPYVRSEVNVRGCDVYVVQSLYSDKDESVADKFLKLLYFAGSLRDASARRITAVIPYLAFSRQDRKTESRAPIMTKYSAELLEAAGCDRLLTMDVHNLSAFQNAFRIQTDNLEAKNLIADYIAEHIDEPEDLVILSPDSGGMSRARRFRNSLNSRLGVDLGLAYLDKSHTGQIIQGHQIVGDVRGKRVIVLDDMISGGSTIRECDTAIMASGGQLWGACCTHALFVGKANENLAKIPRVVVCDTAMCEWRLSEEVRKKVHVISTGRMFGQAIRRTFEEGGSISDLLK
jgi:ribose-phosphate pyrophosphokinase